MHFIVLYILFYLQIFASIVLARFYFYAWVFLDFVDFKS